ncbi:hypothetical protein CONCODRAFT_7370 [Conidiobolus coronatus NRRL 28638]|uniref:SCP domain-containing protein n=1 Tax=Conidiobolus coronatus (strain ATCC 28846 / CBS 209.66 / NRRL 28638) TaxID=796925 RepID=A0A137P5A5_CONC2|nr:hypothetical protein CONCODRAFT_7370 [Conidiobolus coronatus NRRL 28638]|eukprot:KXN70129.1 hypothetical protein CONCODRAFT_7370 [Conidiobolus coronatus NRRL 28638]
MQLSNLFISAIVSYISICDANYQVKQPQPTTIVPSYPTQVPTQVPSYPVKPPTAGNNNDLYFVCKLNEARKARGLKALSYVSNSKSITDNLVNQYATIGHQQNDLFGKFNDAQCSMPFPILYAVTKMVSFSRTNMISSPSQPEYPVEYPVQQPEYPVKQPEYPVKEPETKPTKVEEPKGYPTKPVETQPPKAPQPPKSGVSEEARKSLCLTNKYRRANVLAILTISKMITFSNLPLVLQGNYPNDGIVAQSLTLRSLQRSKKQ